MYSSTILLTLLPVALTAPMASSGSGILLTVPYTPNKALPSNPVQVATGCLDTNAKTLTGAKTTADGCGSFQATTTSMKSDSGYLNLMQASPYPLAANATKESDGFNVWVEYHFLVPKEEQFKLCELKGSF